jgi:acetyl-CoA synthetase
LSNGSYYTGDKAYMDEDGYFWFIGRDDDVIKAPGYRIGPFEVESALIEHPAVEEAAVAGSPGDIRGLIVKAFVLLVPDYKPSDALVKELQNHVRKVTAPYKYPCAIEFVDNLPKTIPGKIRRKEFRGKEMAKVRNEQQGGAEDSRNRPVKKNSQFAVSKNYTVFLEIRNQSFYH